MIELPRTLLKEITADTFREAAIFRGLHFEAK